MEILYNCQGQGQGQGHSQRHHSPSHSFATQMLRDGMSIVILSRILGHASSLTTHNVYIHFLESDKENAVSLLDD